MIRNPIAVLFTSFVLAIVAGGKVRGAEPPAYKVHTEATHIGGDQILVNIKLEQADAASGGSAAKTIARPRLLVLDGNRASITIGEEGPPANPNAAATSKTSEIVSGFNIDVISVKGQDKVLVVSTVIEQRKTVWADAETIKVSPEKAKAK
jgi:hypothetical protein